MYNVVLTISKLTLCKFKSVNLRSCPRNMKSKMCWKVPGSYAEPEDKDVDDDQDEECNDAESKEAKPTTPDTMMLWKR